jgi:hypothetical protein
MLVIADENGLLFPTPLNYNIQLLYQDGRT